MFTVLRKHTLKRFWLSAVTKLNQTYEIVSKIKLKIAAT